MLTEQHHAAGRTTTTLEEKRRCSHACHDGLQPNRRLFIHCVLCCLPCMRVNSGARCPRCGCASLQRGLCCICAEERVHGCGMCWGQEIEQPPITLCIGSCLVSNTPVHDKQQRMHNPMQTRPFISLHSLLSTHNKPPTTNNNNQQSYQPTCIVMSSAGASGDDSARCSAAPASHEDSCPQPRCSAALDSTWSTWASVTTGGDVRINAQGSIRR